jgi:uncharacterized membrane protein YhaH (DUF805 family)
MEHNEFAGLGEIRFRRGAGFFVGILAFLVSALVFFTEATLTAAPIRDVTVSLVVTMLACVVMYTSMTDAGCRAGEEREEYREALSEWKELAANVRSRGLIAGLPAFCRRIAVEERENTRADLLAAEGIDLSRYRLLVEDRAAYLALDRKTRRIVRRVSRVRLLRFRPGELLSSGPQRRAILPQAPGRARLRATAAAMIPALLGSLVTVSVAFSTRGGLDAGAVISALFRLLALLATGVRGYAMGFRSVTVTAVNAARVKSSYLARYLGELSSPALGK